MNSTKRILYPFAGGLLLTLAILLPSGLSALPTDTLHLSRRQAESIYLEQNIRLLAARLDIQIAEARVLQAKLWPNPRFSVEEVNIGATPAQLAMGEELPPFWGSNFGKNQQLAAQLEQTIQIAGKRKKLIGLEQVKQGYALAYFEELLRNVRVELRNMLTELQYLQQFQGVFSRQLPEIQKLMEAYERLSLTGNINRADVVRLKALVLEMMDQQSGLQKQINGIQKELSILLGLEPGVYIQMDTTNFLPSLSEQLVKLDLSELIRRALAERSDIKLSTLELQQAKSALLYEKAVRVPDISLSAGYDRGGNFLYNFWGFGMGIDLPLFNRNQGNIKAAGIGVEKAILLEKEQAQRVKAEVIEAYQNFHSSLQLYREFEGQFENELDHLLVGYTRNFKERNVSMLEFLDFMDSFLESRKIILNTIRSLHRAVDELEYAVGGRLTAEE